MCLLLALTLAATPSPLVIDYHVDCIEINHKFDGDGKLQFDQIIFYKDYHDYGYQVVAWRIIRARHPTKKEDETRNKWVGCPQYPHYNHTSRLWRCIFKDVSSRRIYRITSATFRETWTAYDPELSARNQLPYDVREGLPR